MSTNILATVMWLVTTNWHDPMLVANHNHYVTLGGAYVDEAPGRKYIEEATVTSNKLMICIIDKAAATNTLEKIDFKHLEHQYHYEWLRVGDGATNETEIVHFKPGTIVYTNEVWKPNPGGYIDTSKPMMKIR